jgi:hypothetical protein
MSVATTQTDFFLLPEQQGLEVRARHPDHDPCCSAETDNPLADAGSSLQLGLNFLMLL